MTIFITGATGQLGSHLIDEILATHPFNIHTAAEIVCLVRNPDTAAFLKSCGIRIVVGDLINIESLEKAFQSFLFTHVFHIAANIMVYASWEEMYTTNVQGTSNLLQVFLQSSATKFIYTSSITVYDSKFQNQHNSDCIYSEISPIGTMERGQDIPYAITKRLAEQLVFQAIHEHPEKKFLITRLSAIIGSRDRQMIPSLVESLGFKIPKLVDKGKHRLTLTAPSDIARAQLFLAQLPDNQWGQAFNIANETISYKTLLGYFTDYYSQKPLHFSLPRWVVFLVLPLLQLISRSFPTNRFIQTYLSPSALKYLTRSYIYSSEKLTRLGFQFQTSIAQAVIEGLTEFDPKRTKFKHSHFMEK